jgi:membrane-anchored protein YejM (alkaline phosphatase superfamily)
MSDYFKNNGYLTSQICGCHRKGPNYNYCQGFDRTLYRFSMGCEEVVTNAMEQLRAFKNRSHYMWLTMFETHHFLHGIPDISNQVETDISLRNYRDRNTESPHLPPDLSKRTERYILELQRVDFYLKVLFNYIDDNYSDDEVVVSVCSDHGKTYLDDQPGRLAPHNIQVPMLFKSSDIKSRDETSIVENVDFLPSLLDLSGIEYNPDTLDGQSIFSNNYNKQHAITENIYPGDPYYVVVYSDNYTFHVKSDAPIKTIDDIDIYNCSYSIEDLSGDIIETGITSALQSALAKEQFSYLEKRQRS